MVLVNYIENVSMAACLSDQFYLLYKHLHTTTYKPAKFLMPILQPLTTNKCTGKDSLTFPLKLFIKMPVTSWEP